MDMVKKTDMISNGMTQYPEYCAVIRTLGTAGDKFEQEIDSLLAQNHRPAKILAYIPHGYDIPQFANSDKVEFVRTEKGMVTQRSQPFDEVTTPYILFLDDDVYLAPDSVTKLFDALADFDADCVGADVFEIYKLPFVHKVVNLFAGVWPILSRRWSIKIKAGSNFFYNLRPKDVMESQSNSGPCSLCKTEVYKAIHFEDERWIEAGGYALGDDQLFFYKMHIQGFKVLTHHNCGIVHLDAVSSGGIKHEKDSQTKLMYIRYCLWYRTMYQLATNPWQKFVRTISFYCLQTSALFIDTFIGIVKRRSLPVLPRFKGVRNAKAFVRSSEYKAIPRFDAYAS